jgi:hypothetical protein
LGKISDFQTGSKKGWSKKVREAMDAVNLDIENENEWISYDRFFII